MTTLEKVLQELNAATYTHTGGHCELPATPTQRPYYHRGVSWCSKVLHYLRLRRVVLMAQSAAKGRNCVGFWRPCRC